MAAGQDENGLVTAHMSADMYHRYIGIDAFVDAWMLNNL